MKFLIDAQLPLRLSVMLSGAGHASVHTSELPDGNRTSDRELTALADRDERVLVTKDGGFRDSHLLYGRPCRLLLVRTGNIANNDLLVLFDANLALLLEAFEEASLVEISSTSVVVHGGA